VHPEGCPAKRTVQRKDGDDGDAPTEYTVVRMETGRGGRGFTLESWILPGHLVVVVARGATDAVLVVSDLAVESSSGQPTGRGRRTRVRTDGRLIQVRDRRPTVAQIAAVGGGSGSTSTARDRGSVTGGISCQLPKRQGVRRAAACVGIAIPVVAGASSCACARMAVSR
jgi:hypothetical protein